jgi:hypothetical protein
MMVGNSTVVTITSDFSRVDSKQVVNEEISKIKSETMTVENVADVYLQQIVIPSLSPVVRIQSLWRGITIRKKVSIRTITPGMILVRLRGDSIIFGSQDFKGYAPKSNSPVAPRCVSYLSLEKLQFKGGVLAHNDMLINPVRLNLSNINELAKISHDMFVVVNGGFFNHKRLASQDVPEHISVGKVVVQGDELTSLPIPSCYMEDYSPISFEDNSLLEVGPTLSQSGKVVFSEARLADPKYDVQRNDLGYEIPIVPGELRHAAGRHPRAAISNSIGHLSGRVRLIVGTVPERDVNPDSGYTLPEWACVTARIDRLSTPCNSSINLDGGGSVSLVVRDSDGERLTISQTVGGRNVANAIGFFKR